MGQQEGLPYTLSRNSFQDLEIVVRETTKAKVDPG
jgi:hypothetical protein